MKPAKIFKVKGVDRNVIFQLLSDKTIAILAVVFTGVIVFFYGEAYSLQSRIIFVSIVGFVIYTFLAIEMEGQKVYSLIPKAIGHVYKPKRVEKLSEAEFRVVNDCIITSDKIIKAYVIEPIDYFLLAEDEKAHFYNQLQNFLNNLRENHIQIIVRNREATEKDYLKHLDSVDSDISTLSTTETQKRREAHLEGYKANLKELLQHNIIPIREYIMLIKIDCDTTSKEAINRKLKDLTDLSDRIQRNLKRATISSSHLEGDNLTRFLTKYFSLH